MALAEWHVGIAAFIAAGGPPEAGGSGTDDCPAVLANQMVTGRA